MDRLLFRRRSLKWRHGTLPEEDASGYWVWFSRVPDGMQFACRDRWGQVRWYIRDGDLGRRIGKEVIDRQRETFSRNTQVFVTNLEGLL